MFDCSAMATSTALTRFIPSSHPPCLSSSSFISQFPLPFPFQAPHPPCSSSCFLKIQRSVIRCKVKDSVKEVKEAPVVDADEVTQKYGLEMGLWKIFSAKSDGDKDSKAKKTSQAKELLARYGGAYLATSISLSAVSFGLCYLLISYGVDVPGLLEKIGISTDSTGEKVGTLALAYAAHKAASPIRFPPTVALTPIVANWFGKSNKENPPEEVEQ